MVHAELDHGEPVRMRAAQQRQRQADLVVEVARGRERPRRRRAPARRIDAIISLTVVLPLLPTTTATGNVEARAPVRGQRAERGQRVVDGDQVAGKTRRRGRARPAPRPRRRRSACGDEIVAVEALALQRDEQVAGHERCACRWSRAKSHRCAPMRLSGHRAGGGRRIHHARLRRASAAPATPTIGERQALTPFTSW